MNTRCPVILTLSLVALLIATASAQDKGSIRGIVVDEGGTPVVDAKVNASPLGGWRTVRFLRYATTDADGRFLLDALEFGKYGVFAMKEEALYPNMSSSFYSDNVFPTAVITPAAPIAVLRIQLGSTAGVLTGSITNVANGAPLNAGFKLTRAASPDKWLSTSAPPNYRILIPSSTDVLLEVSAPGFETWSPGRPVRLQPGSELRLDIVLQPSHDPNLHPSRFLVPEGYVGWLLLEYNMKAAQAAPVEGAVKVFRFPASGTLEISSSGPERGAEDQYFFYSIDGALHEIPTDYRNGKGMIWGQHEGTRDGTLSQFGFFVGTEAQYRKFQTRMTRPGPVAVTQP